MTRSLQSRLIVVLSSCVVVLGIVAGYVSYEFAFRDAYRFQDDQLIQVAALVDTHNLATIDSEVRSMPIHDFDYRLTVQPLGGVFPKTLSDGFNTLEANGHTWRAYVRTLDDGRVRIAVGQPTEGRNEIARNSGFRTALPFFAIIPLLILLIAVTVRRTWHPVTVLSAGIDARSDTDLRPIETKIAPPEIAPFIISINRLLARLDVALTEQRRFVADAAHELRSPITALVIQAENLDHRALDEETRTRLDKLKAGLKRTRELLEQLLTLARIQSAQPISIGPVALRQAVHVALEDAYPLADQKSIMLDVDDLAPAMLVDASRADIATVLRNLVDNAVRYTPRNGNVTIRLAKSAGMAVIDVIDTGPGIPAAQRAHVFDAFYRGHGNREEGTGLGLAIVRATIDRLGGTIELGDDRPAEPHGLHVHVTLPLHRASGMAT
ncbi:Sensor protein QseC [Pandoraea terrae]|uniref:histidine kinase n=1 Tax=Pandoraea terrae TaxID=1537710 RepID=A0A5E4SB36_9BURK|nr:ATP-binding protein [Pandoraea terrae]VVD71784.1 Sensor protein QseC [Pandoraea terrae]